MKGPSESRWKEDECGLNSSVGGTASPEDAGRTVLRDSSAVM